MKNTNTLPIDTVNFLNNYKRLKTFIFFLLNHNFECHIKSDSPDSALGIQQPDPVLDC